MLSSVIKWSEIVELAKQTAAILGTPYVAELTNIATGTACKAAIDGDVILLVTNEEPPEPIVREMKAEVAAYEHPIELRPCRLIVTREGETIVMHEGEM